MAKAKDQASTGLTETLQNNDFAEPEDEPAPRGSDREAEIEAIRAVRAKQRAARGAAGKRRTITHYHDAERLVNLQRIHDAKRAARPELPERTYITPEEHVDCEEAGLLPDPRHFATGSTALDGMPPDEDVG